MNDQPIAAIRDRADADRREVEGAIALVAEGVAVDVMLCGLHAPEEAAAAARAAAASASVSIRVERDEAGVTLIVGPRVA